MKRTSFYLCLGVSVCVAIVLFHVKYKVIGIEQQIAKVNYQILGNREAIHVLKAEWSHLNNPTILGKLNQKYLNYVAPKADQILRESGEGAHVSP